METKCTSTPHECHDACVSADGLGTVWAAIEDRRKKLLRYLEIFRQPHCRLIKRPSPKESCVLTSYRTSRVSGNELHVMKYDDPSHGWIAVPRKWVLALGIEAFTSSWSYQRGNYVYLEEDDDAARFRIAAERFGYKLFVSVRHTDKRSPIRSLECFGLRENELGD